MCLRKTKEIEQGRWRRTRGPGCSLIPDLSRSVAGAVAVFVCLLSFRFVTTSKFVWKTAEGALARPPRLPAAQGAAQRKPRKSPDLIAQREPNAPFICCAHSGG